MRLGSYNKEYQEKLIRNSYSFGINKLFTTEKRLDCFKILVYGKDFLGTHVTTYCLCRLIIPKGSRVLLTEDKCRASVAYVKSINELETYYDPNSPHGHGVRILGNEFSKAYSPFFPEFEYKVHKKVKPYSEFSESTAKCASGIHFFLTKEKALEYLFKLK